MRNLMMGLLGATALVIASAANAVINVDFGSAPGDLGTDHTYSTGAGTVVASGFDDIFFSGDLYGKNFGGDEQGLGLADDPSGQNEIYSGSSEFGSFIQLDVSGLFGSVGLAQFFMGSTTNGEGWFVIGSNVDGCGWICGDGSTYLPGSDEGTLHNLPGWGKEQYYDFYSTGTNGETFGNVLLGGLVLTPGVPEPGTWAMMLLGFGALGIAVRRGRNDKLSIAQFA
jgi:hypothetical protein